MVCGGWCCSHAPVRAPGEGKGWSVSGVTGNCNREEKLLQAWVRIIRMFNGNWYGIFHAGTSLLVSYIFLFSKWVWSGLVYYLFLRQGGDHRRSCP